MFNAKLFSIVDNIIRSAYCPVLLDNESCLRTTFSTPYGGYRWVRMPSGCNVSLEIFQKKLFKCLDGLAGIHCVADDIMINGRGETEKDALVDYENNLIALMKRWCDGGIRLNPDEMTLSQDHVPFTADGLKPDHAKVKAIIYMPRPIDIEGVQWFNGFVQWISSQNQ